MVTDVLVQFSFSNRNVVPRWVTAIHPETRKEMTNRVNGNGHEAGIQIISPTERCDLRDFPANLKENGFRLVGALYQKRMDPKRPGKTFHMVRFVFSLDSEEHKEASKELKEARKRIASEFEKICEDAMWRVTVYKNPRSEGNEGVSVNLSVRDPYLSDGKPAAERAQDKDGKKIGKPMPKRPKFLIRFSDGDLEWGEPIYEDTEIAEN